MPNSIDLNPREDFWSRRRNAQTVSFDFAPCGIPARLTANQSEILAAAQLSARRFSRAREASGPPIRIRIIVRSNGEPTAPEMLSEHLEYSGLEHWITLSAGRWGHGFANLQDREAVIVLSPGLAGQSRLVSRYFIDHYLLNFILTEWAMLHASCVLAPGGQRLIVMIAPHNVGKSTTALRLLRSGYTFLADGMVLLRPHPQGFTVGGYPVGEVKLRDDVLAMFPEYTGPTVQIREERKSVIDLRPMHPDRLVEALIQPPVIQLCFVERGNSTHTRVTALSPEEVGPRLAANTLYWDEAPRLAHNRKTLQSLLQTAPLYRLEIGADADGIAAAINELG